MIPLTNRVLSKISLSILTLAAVATLSVHPAVAASSNVCIALSNSNGLIGGLQLDLTWAPGCMSAAQGGKLCTANAATGKDVHQKVTGSMMRALFLSTSDVSPIPDGELFCCRFESTPSPQSPCCSVGFSNVILSSPTGQRQNQGSLQAFVDGALCADTGGGGSQQPPPAHGLLPQAPVAPPVVSVPGGGPAGGGAAAPGGGSVPGAPGRAAPNIVQGIAPPAEQAPAGAGEATPGEGTPAPTSPVVSHPAPTAIPTARRTPVAATTPTMKAPAPHATVTAALKSATPGATPKKHKKHKAAPKPTPE